MGGLNVLMKKLREHTSMIDFLRERHFRSPDNTGHFPLLRLNELIDAPAYKTFRIPKKKTGFRIINSPVFDLKGIQHLINIELQKEYCIEMRPPCVHGFVSGKNESETRLGIYTNALPHVNKGFVMNMDIKDFFSSIKARAIKSLLVSRLGLNDNMASVITRLCTYENALPAGAPTSPVLSNLYCIGMDKELMQYADRHNCTYTRYADDLTFSSDTEISTYFIENIKEILERNHFAVNNRKFRVKTRHQRQTVTGLVVNNKVNVNRKYKRMLRAINHDINKNGLRAAALKHFKILSSFPELDHEKFGQKVKGMKAFVEGINRENESMNNNK